MTIAEGCACGKKTVRTEEQKKTLAHRLNRIEGQVRGLQAMLEKDAYCNDILIQTSAVQAALKSFSRELLRAHLHGCVARDVRAGQDETLDELADTIGRLL